MRTSYENQLAHRFDSKLTGHRVNGETLLFLGTGAIAQNCVFGQSVWNENCRSQ